MHADRSRHSENKFPIAKNSSTILCAQISRSSMDLQTAIFLSAWVLSMVAVVLLDLGVISMFMSKNLSLLVVAVAVTAIPALGNAQESKIRQANQNKVIKGNIGGMVKFTVAGQPNDIAIVTLNDGTIFAALSIKDLRNSIFSGGSYVGSGGDIAVRVRISNAQPAFDRGRVLIYRGFVLIDSDPVRLR